MQALDSGFVKYGKKVVIFLRLSFFIPAVVINYVLGITSTSFTDYVLGSCILVINSAILVLFGCSLDTFS